jgi:phage shock protein E
MINTLKKFLGLGPKADYAGLLSSGGLILDVRSRGEYEGGHVSGSLNVPLDQLGDQLKKLNDKTQPIITCCASGMRSASAKRFLLAQGYTNVHNGGSWMSLRKFGK